MNEWNLLYDKKYYKHHLIAINKKFRLFFKIYLLLLPKKIYNEIELILFT